MSSRQGLNYTSPLLTGNLLKSSPGPRHRIGALYESRVIRPEPDGNVHQWDWTKSRLPRLLASPSSKCQAKAILHRSGFGYDTRRSDIQWITPRIYQLRLSVWNSSNVPLQ